MKVEFLLTKGFRDDFSTLFLCYLVDKF